MVVIHAIYSLCLYRKSTLFNIKRQVKITLFNKTASFGGLTRSSFTLLQGQFPNASAHIPAFRQPENLYLDSHSYSKSLLSLMTRAALRLRKCFQNYDN